MRIIEGTKLLPLKIKLFADGAIREEIRELYRNPLIKGFTTNPTLIRRAGVTDYEDFARGILSEIKDRPISLEVLTDDFAEMERQAHKLAAWGENVYVKVPITNTKAESSAQLVKRLSEAGIKLNVTALMTVEQTKQAIGALTKCSSAFVSVFAGRIADTGQDPIPIMSEVVSLLKQTPNIELIWASPRELLNVVQAESLGCHVITATADILKKVAWIGRDLDELSLDTVKMFHRDAAQAGFKL